MIRRILPFFLTIILLSVLACPDPGSTASPGTPGTEDESPTTEEITRAVELLLDAAEDDDLLDLSLTAGSGVELDKVTDGFILTMTDADITGFDFNTAGFRTITGTIGVSWAGGKEEYAIDVTLTGGALSRIQCTLNLKTSAPSFTVTVDGTDYSIPVPGSDDVTTPGIPDFCGIGYDSETVANIKNPNGWVVPHPPMDSEYGTAGEDDCSVYSTASGSYSYEGYSFPYSLSCSADASSSGPGTVTLTAETSMDVQGFQESTSDTYQIYGTSSHKAYFSASSDDENTREIHVQFSLQAGGSLYCSPESSNGEWAGVYTSLSAAADIYPMGWIPAETGQGERWAICGDALSDVQGYALVCDDPSDEDAASCSSGFFMGQITKNDHNKSVDGSADITAKIKPDEEMMCLSLNLDVTSTVEFDGWNNGPAPEERGGSGVSQCQYGQLSYAYTAYDPDNPDAEITVKFYVPLF